MFAACWVQPPSLLLERLGAARERNAVESRFGDGQQRAAGRFLETELDERGRLLRVVRLRIDGVRMPAVRKVVLGLDPFDDHLERQVLVAGIRDLTARRCALRKRRGQLDSEPFAELRGVGERAPHPRAGCAQNDLLLDAIGHDR